MKKIISLLLFSVLCAIPGCSQMSAYNNDFTCYATGMTVYVTPKGAKYHKRDCSTLSRSKKVNALDIAAAKAKGYTACKVCF